MENRYKHHKIVASTWQLSDSGHWEPRILVTWNEGQQEKSKALVFTGAFSTEREAELDGLKLARKWIGKGQTGACCRPQIEPGLRKSLCLKPATLTTTIVSILDRNDSLPDFGTQRCDRRWHSFCAVSEYDSSAEN